MRKVAALVVMALMLFVLPVVSADDDEWTERASRNSVVEWIYVLEADVTGRPHIEAVDLLMANSKINGIIQGMDYALMIHEAMFDEKCYGTGIPGGLSNGQIQQMWINFARENADIWHIGARQLTYRFLYTKFGCGWVM